LLYIVTIIVKNITQKGNIIPESITSKPVYATSNNSGLF